MNAGCLHHHHREFRHQTPGIALSLAWASRNTREVCAIPSTRYSQVHNPDIGQQYLSVICLQRRLLLLRQWTTRVLTGPTSAAELLIVMWQRTREATNKIAAQSGARCRPDKQRHLQNQSSGHRGLERSLVTRISAPSKPIQIQRLFHRQISRCTKLHHNGRIACKSETISHHSSSNAGPPLKFSYAFQQRFRTIATADPSLIPLCGCRSA